ncbi:MAG: type II toxin-antitoxin system RelE/ParE family toxin [Nocardioides sp.]
MFDKLKSAHRLRIGQGKLRILDAHPIDRSPTANPGDVKPVGRGVSELLLTYGPGYRVYYLQDGDRLILLPRRGDKSTQPTDIEKDENHDEE